MNLSNVITLLNSGNVIFKANDDNDLENKISQHLEKTFGFPIPTLIRKSEMIIGLLSNNPFRAMEITEDLRLYVSFLREEMNPELNLPWKSPDEAYHIIEQKGRTVFSVLDLSVSKTPKAMEALEKYFGKDITTRNWNTIGRIVKKANA